MNTHHNKAESRTALVTGGSSGIGLELSRILAANGYDVVLVARDHARLESVAAELRHRHGTPVATVAADLARPEGASIVAEAVQLQGLTVDVLVNSAGRGTYGAFATSSFDDERDMLQLNVVSLTALTRYFLPAMIARHHGMVLNLASTAAFVPGPLMAVYYATKSYVLSFSESIASELEGTGVTVTALCPPATESGFQAAARMEASRLVSGKRLLAADAVARAGYKGMVSGKRVVVPGVANWLSVQVVPLFPRRLLATYVRKLQAPTDA